MRHTLDRWLFAAVLLATACGDAAPGRERVAMRLVDPALRVGAKVEPSFLVSRDAQSLPVQTGEFARIPQATLCNDTRPVLASHEFVFLAHERPLMPAEREARAIFLPLGPTMAGASEVAAALQTRSASGRWQTFPTMLMPVREANGRRSVRLDLPRDLADAEPVKVFATGRRTPGARTVYETMEVPFPPTATLEVGYGAVDQIPDAGDVRFSIEACRGGRCSLLFEDALRLGDGSAGCWSERRVALPDLEGEPYALRFTTQRSDENAFAFPVWGDPTVLVPTWEAHGSPNIVLVSIDTLGAGHLDLYGYPRPTAPFLGGGIASGGVVFEHLVAEASTTDPSHMTMFTSLPAAVHGVSCCLKGLAVPVVTLAEALRSNGYRTAAFTEDGPLAHGRGFSLGFDRYGENVSQNILRPEGQIERTFTQAREWLEAHSRAPFFLFLHTFQVHEPYDPPATHAGRFTDVPVAGPPAAKDHVDRYDAEISFVDDALKGLYEWMEAQGSNDGTIWVVLSDHGEEFLEHGSFGHGTLPYETVLHVPLVIRGPGVRAGEREASVVHHIDLMPTLLELAGIEPPAGLLGESFAGLVTRRPGRRAWSARPAFSSSWVLPNGFEAPARAVRVGDHKLIRYRRGGTPHFELYDVSTDPDERHDIAPREPDVVTRLDALLEEREQLLQALRMRGGRGTADEGRAIPLDPEREAMLRSLGYIE